MEVAATYSDDIRVEESEDVHDVDDDQAEEVSDVTKACVEAEGPPAVECITSVAKEAESHVAPAADRQVRNLYEHLSHVSRRCSCW